VSNPDIHIEIGDQRTPDVDAGFRLYANLTSHSPDPATIRQWLYWYDENPFGKGVYAVAKSGAEVVGFYSLIPVEMQIDGQLVRGAKGECFVVSRNSRKVPFGPQATRLPVALSSELHRAAARFGMACLFLVGTPAAALCHAASGAGTITYDTDQFVMPFWGASGGTFKSRCKAFLEAGYSATRRRIGAIRRIGARHGSFEIGGIPQKTPTHPGNLLVSDQAEMLTYRFPATRYLVYSVSDVHDARGLLVFNMPRCGENVCLKHWSREQIPFENMAAVLNDVIRRSRQAGAASVSVVVPRSERDAFVSIRQLGFLHRRSTASVQIYWGGAEPVGPTLSWRFTNSHKGFFGFA
jgi:hypothetical protein